MRLALLISLTLTLALAVGAGGATRTGVLYGTVTRGPVTPVCAEAEPCYLPAARTAIAFLRNGRVAARTRTRADGTYRIRLAAGRYTIRVGGGRRWSPPAALVRRGRTARVDISIDTGIR
ncbi:MAG TPA: hypothetical protein VKC62_02485 [Gaiellaceae bacterium]|nr:hypothetical protein [Gaiellaceae bacterium]